MLIKYANLIITLLYLSSSDIHTFVTYRNHNFRPDNNLLIFGGKKRALVLYNPNDPRPDLWTKINFPEQYPMIELKAVKYKMGNVVAPNGYVEVITALFIPPQMICQFDDFGRCLVSFGKPLWEKRWHKKPHLGKLSRVGANFSRLASVKLQPPHDFSLGQLLDCSLFANCTHVKVSGITKGKGFSGAIKRHGFQRGPTTHGSKHHRKIGSIGASTTPGRVFPGKKMPGRMGGTSATFRRLKLIGINVESNLIFVKGSVPGNKGSYVSVTTDMKGVPDPRFTPTIDVSLN